MSEMPEQVSEDQAFDHFANAIDKELSGEMPEANDTPELTEEAPTEEPEPTVEAEAETTEPVDIWQGASDEQQQEYQALQAKVAQLEHADRSNRGRISGLQKKLNDVFTQQSAPPESKPETEESTNSNIDELAADYPDIDQLIQARLKGVQGEIDQRINPIYEQSRIQQEQADAAAREAEMNTLLDKHPDAIEVAQSGEFQNWIGQQSPGIQSLYGSASAADNDVLLSLFKQTNQQQQPDLSEMAEPPRKSGSNRPVAGPASSDSDGWFDHFATQIDQRKL